MDICSRRYLLGLLSLIFSGCWSNDSHLKSMPLEQGPLVINVLDKELYDDCHIIGSIQVDFEDIESYVKDIDKDTEIVVYCSNYMCNTSHHVGKKLLQLGYDRVFVYEGGMAEWKQHGLPTVGPGKAAYLTKIVVQSQGVRDTSVPVISMHELAEKLQVDIVV